VEGFVRTKASNVEFVERRGVMVCTPGSETGYPAQAFSWFSSVPAGRCCSSTL